MKKISQLLINMFILGFLCSCSSGKDQLITDYLQKPEEVHIFTVPANAFSREVLDNKAHLLNGFPFISTQSVTNNKGKFPPEFYASALKEFHVESLQKVDFWSLKNNPHLYDVIYIKPMLIGEFKIKGKDLLESIAYSYNISTDQLAILDNWIKSGGILWLESGIYISLYDYKFNKFSDKELESFLRKLNGMTLFDRKLNILILRAKKTDEIHVEGISQEIVSGESGTFGEVSEINEKIRSLLLEQSDYIGIYLSVDATPIIKKGNKVYASYLELGKGKIITLPPFDFVSTYHDGELFRLTLLSWALDNRK
jgi:hypothetical protein